MLAELSNLHGVVIGGLLFVGVPVGVLVWEAWPHIREERRSALVRRARALEAMERTTRRVNEETR